MQQLSNDVQTSEAKITDGWLLSEKQVPVPYWCSCGEDRRHHQSLWRSKMCLIVYWHWSQDASIFSCVSLLIDVRGRHLSKQPVCGGWGMFVLLSQQEAWWESSRVTAGWGFVAVVWQGVASTDPTDCWFNNSSNNQSLGLCVPFTEDNFNQAWLSCWCS